MNAVAVAPVVKAPVVNSGQAEDTLAIPKIATSPGAHPVVGNLPVAGVNPNAEFAAASFVPVKSQCTVRGPDDETNPM